jgi:pyruvate dehydrogenase E1 component alpha subunit/2-oxoisovalerate dehydrogenase E1 component alpha subunit
MMTFRRKGHAEHDNQHYMPPGEIERWAAENDPIDRYIVRLTRDFSITTDELLAIDQDVATEVYAATDTAEMSPACDGAEALTGVYADPPVMPTLWYRGDAAKAVDAHERPTSWGTHDG